MENNIDPNYVPNHSHAWRGSWDRPMLIDENKNHPFTIARMTDHNVRGHDAEISQSELPPHEELEKWEDDGGLVPKLMWI